MYKKVPLEQMSNKLAEILIIDEAINGNCIFPFLFRLLPVKNLVNVPIIADMVNPKPISVADNPILLKMSDVK